MPRTQRNQQILDEAAEWLVEVREGDLDAAGQREFAIWLRRSPEHIKAYLEVAAFWADAPQLAFKEEIDVEALIAYARAEDNVVSLNDEAGAGNGRWRRASGEDSAAGQTSDQSSGKRGSLHTNAPVWRPRRLAAAAAAIAVVCLGITSAVWLLGQRGQTYETAIGEQRSVTLADGSTIDMNARSRIRIRFTKQARDVDLLDGQALFTVARDPARPFTVSSDNTRVRAIGTQFVVYRRKSGTTVTVLEGKVSVLPVSQAGASELVDEMQPKASALPRSTSRSHRARQPVFLTAGEQVMLSALTPVAPRSADMAAATAWTQRQIVFQGTPLTEVVEEFNRYNVRQMIIRDTDLASVRVSGIFSSTQPGSLLRFLREQVGLVVDESEDSIDISRR
jgi:transmembrane sensor